MNKNKQVLVQLLPLMRAVEQQARKKKQVRKKKRNKEKEAMIGKMNRTQMKNENQNYLVE